MSVGPFWPGEAAKLATASHASETAPHDPASKKRAGLAPHEVAILEAELVRLRGPGDGKYRDFIAGVAAGALADAMTPAGEAVAAFWRSGAGSGGELSVDAADRIARVAIGLLGRERSYGAWEAFSGLPYWSNTVRKALGLELATLLSADDDLATWFLGFVAALVEDAAADPVARAGSFDKAGLGATLAHWRDNRDLNTLLSGLPGWRFGWFHEDAVHSALIAVGRQRPDALPTLLHRLGDPHSTVSALHRIGVNRRFRLWRTLVEGTPPCFGCDGTWSGDVLVPLLLALGLEALREVPFSPDGRPEVGADNLHDTIAEMADAIAARPDAIPLSARWGAWLAAAAIRRRSRTDRRGTGEPLEMEILSALVRRIPSEAWAEDLAGAPTAEAWCRRIPATMAALEGRRGMPGTDGIVAAWNLSPEGWLGQPGEDLQTRADPFTGEVNWPAGLGSGALGIPFAFAPDTGAGWGDLWRGTTTLREAVEFGDLQSVGVRRLNGARDLLRLAFAMGLSALEQIVVMGRGGGDLVGRVSRLFGALVDAATEMGEIECLHPDAWNAALRHLAVRRACWSMAPADGQPRAVTLPPDLEPTLSCFFQRAAGDAVEIALYAATLHRNGITGVAVRTAARNAGIDLDEAIAAVEHLARVDSRRPGLLEIVADVRPFAG